MGFFWIFYKFSVLAWFLLKHKRQITGHTSHAIFNNTVEIGVEQARYGRAVVDYQASVQFMENKISGLRKAFRGE